MKFLCLGYFDPAKMRALPPERVDALMQECQPHMEAQYGTGKVVAVFGADDEARHLRLSGGKLDVSDHDAATPEKVGCVFVLEAADMEEAVRLAALHPTTQIAAGEALGWRTEVRPVQYLYRGGDDLPGAAGGAGSAG